MSIKATSVRGVAALLKAGKAGQHAAGGSLYLKVNGENKGSWFFRYKIDGKTSRMGLGSTDAVTLADARQMAAEQRALLAKGIDPLAHRNAQDEAIKAETITFDQVAADYIEAQRSSWTNAKHAQQWANTLATYASPVIGHLAPADVTTEHILKILNPIWNTKKETASRVRNRIELILNAAKARKLRTGENVAAWRGHLDLLLANHKKNDRRHHPAIPWPQVNDLYQALVEANDTSSQALRLTILTALRTSEVLGAQWSEFNFESAVWTVPAERMKASKEHRVPLSTAVIELLSTIPRTESGLLFEGRTAGKPVSNMAMLMKIRRMDEAKYEQDRMGWRDEKGQTITPHGFRSTFRDWAAENTSFENIVVEQALAHSIGNAVEAAYRRGDLLERRRELMEAWGEYVTRPADSNVIQLHKEA